MTGSHWLLLGIGAAVASASMAALWLLQVRIRDASHVDVGWALLSGASGLLYAVLGDGSGWTRALVAVLGLAWGLRLGLYLLVNRVLGKEEDGRYASLREQWAPHEQLRFFLFFQAQAAFVVVFSLPFLFAALDDDGLGALELAGAVLWALAWTGEITADVQLARWRNEPGNRGKTARNGLWGWSRHPNYFFEWLIWVAFAVIALGSPWGWIAVVTPAFLLLLLFRVTGIPANEAQALRSRGEDYRRYQQEVSTFVPLPPRQAS